MSKVGRFDDKFAGQTVFAARRDDMERLSEFIECMNCGYTMRYPVLEVKVGVIPRRCPQCGKTGADLPPGDVRLEVFA